MKKLLIITIFLTSGICYSQDSISLYDNEYRYYLMRDQRATDCDAEMFLKSIQITNLKNDSILFEKKVSHLQSQIMLSNELTRLAKQSILISDESVKFQKKQVLWWKFLSASICLSGIISTGYFILH